QIILKRDGLANHQSTSLESMSSYPIAGGSMAGAVEQKVKQIIVEQLGVDENQVDNNASFVDDLGADSLDIVELVMAFEEAFELEIPDEDAEKIATVKDAIDYIENNTPNKYLPPSPAESVSSRRAVATGVGVLT